MGWEHEMITVKAPSKKITFTVLERLDCPSIDTMIAIRCWAMLGLDISKGKSVVETQDPYGNITLEVI